MGLCGRAEKMIFSFMHLEISMLGGSQKFQEMLREKPRIRAQPNGERDFFLGQLLPRKNRNPKSENRPPRQPLQRDVRISEIGRLMPSWERCSWGALLKRAL